MNGPLDGVRIIDLTTMISGPWATMILGDQGADVIKIEPPEAGDHVRSLGHRRNGLSAMFLNVNRNKRSLTINLKTEEGVALVKELAATADVFVQNFRPGVAQRLGLGEEALRDVRADIIYVSISGFGETGPYASKPTYDPIIQAISGLASVQAGADELQPRLIRTILPDKLAGITAAQAICAALYERTKSRRGQHVRLSMLDGVLSFLWASDMGAYTFADDGIGGAEAASFIDLIYQTKNGYMTVAVMTDKQWVGFAQAVEQPQWLADERFKTAALRDTHVNERLEMTQQVLVQKTTEEWLELFEPLEIPCAPALTRGQAINHPQVAASQTIQRFHHKIAGELQQARPAARFDRTPATMRSGAPTLGEHSVEILRELGRTDAEIARLLKECIVGSG